MVGKKKMKKDSFDLRRKVLISETVRYSNLQETFSKTFPKGTKQSPNNFFFKLR